MNKNEQVHVAFLLGRAFKPEGSEALTHLVRTNVCLSLVDSGYKLGDLYAHTHYAMPHPKRYDEQLLVVVIGDPIDMDAAYDQYYPYPNVFYLHMNPSLFGVESYLDVKSLATAINFNEMSVVERKVNVLRIDDNESDFDDNIVSNLVVLSSHEEGVTTKFKIELGEQVVFDGDSEFGIIMFNPLQNEVTINISIGGDDIHQKVYNLGDKLPVRISCETDMLIENNFDEDDPYFLYGGDYPVGATILPSEKIVKVLI